MISQADGSLLPGHSGVYCYGGSWFLNDAANYVLAGVHGLPAAEVDALLVERIARAIARVPAFNSRYWYRRAGKMACVEREPLAELREIRTIVGG